MIKLKPGMRVKCNSEDEAKEFIKLAYKQGFKWNDDITKDDYTAWVLENSWIYYYLNADMRITYNFNVYLTDTFINYSDLKKGEYENMTKSDLENGMVVELRNGNRYLVHNDKFIRNNAYTKIDNFNNELLFPTKPQYDIIKVYKSNAMLIEDLFDNFYLYLIWVRKEDKQELSKKDKKIIKKGLKKVQDVCKEHKDCFGCPLLVGNDCPLDDTDEFDMDKLFKD